MAEMNKAQVKACVDYINKFAAELHGVPAGALDVGPEIEVKNVISAQAYDDTGILVVDRGIKGVPKYVLSLTEVKANEAPVKSSEAVEAEAKKVDKVKERLGG